MYRLKLGKHNRGMDKNIRTEVKDYTGAKYAISISNGTNALKLSLFTTGVARDNEVLTSPISFVATANAISHVGAVRY